MWETRTDEQLLNDYKEDHFNKVVPHEACWDLNQRGGVGETPFQILYLVDSPESHAVGEILLRLYPKLSLDVYEGEEYFGKLYDTIQLVFTHICKYNFCLLRGYLKSHLKQSPLHFGTKIYSCLSNKAGGCLMQCFNSYRKLH